jgi:hypothetical protein
MKKQNTTPYSVWAAMIFVVVFSAALLWLLDGSTNPDPLGADAASGCTEDVVSQAATKIKLGFEPQNTIAADRNFEVVAVVDLGTEGPACPSDPDVTLEGQFIFYPSGQIVLQKRSPVMPVIFGSTEEDFEILFSASWNELFEDKEIQDKATMNVVAIIYYNKDEVGRSKAASITVTASDQGSGSGTGTSTGSGSGTGVGSGGTGSGSGSGRGTGSGSGTRPSNPSAAPSGTSEYCDSKYFTYDSKSGLCLPKLAGEKGSLANQGSIYELINRLIKTLLTFAGIAAVIVLIIGGFLFITSAGNEEQAGRGRKAITYALIGLVVVLMSYAIVSVVSRFITSSTT